MNKNQVIDLINSGKTVTVQLTGAEVVSVKQDYKPINRFYTGTLYKIVVKDPVLGAVYFGTFSDRLRGVDRGDKISLKVTLTGIGEASERFPDPILFAKPFTRKGDAVAIDRPVVEYANDLPNV